MKALKTLGAALIRYFYASEGYLKTHDTIDTDTALNKLIWIDLLYPDMNEINQIDREFSLDLPTQDEMKEIEISSRLYVENNVLYMTMNYIADALGDMPQTTQLTFVLKDDLLLTMRYKEMRIVNYYIEKAAVKGLGNVKSGQDLLLFILENFVDLCADALEKNHTDIETLNNTIFDQSGKKHDYKQSLKTIAKIGDLNSKVRESLVSLSRLATFWNGTLEEQRAEKENRIKLRSVMSDVSALLDHAAFVSSKIAFVLDATLGLVNLEQNAIIKIFSVAAVIFLPPTLVASIYGMNFEHMPELSWVMGYPAALIMMLVSAILPYYFFKHKGWL